MDRDKSMLLDGTAAIFIKAEHGIPTHDVTLGLISIRAGEPTFRANFGANEISWNDDGEYLIGRLECQVPPSRPVQAIASLAGTAFHYWWIVDPNLVANPRKVVFEEVDPGLSLLRDFLVVDGQKGGARDLESAVAWIFWMLGFGVAHFGTNTRTQDAVDIVIVTPSGNFAVVECTTGVISTDKKVANLLGRRVRALERLSRSNHNAVKVLPIIVTSRGRAEVAQEIEPAQQRGVLVLTREDLIELLNQVETMPDPDSLYQQAEETLESAKPQLEPRLPGLA